MKKLSAKNSLPLIALLLSALTPSARAEVAPSSENGVSAQEIRIGSTGGITGAVAEVGGGMAEGARVYYDRINASGGVNGRRIRFIPLDDHYDPTKAVTNAVNLIDREGVFALVGGNGTPIAQAIMPKVLASGTPFLFTQTGGEIMYQPVKKNVFQLRISYQDEAASLMNFAVKDLRLQKIAVFYQEDAFGNSGRSGAAKTLAESGLKFVGEGTYKRGTTDVDAAVSAIQTSGADAVFMQAVGTAATAFIKKCLEKGYRPLFFGTSPMGSIQMAEQVGKLPVTLYVSEVLPSPLEPKIPLVREFQRDMKAAGHKDVNYFNFEGYVGAAVFVQAIRKMGKDVTREGLIRTLENMKDLDLGGLRISFSLTDHRALNTNYIVRLKDGKLTSVH